MYTRKELNGMFTEGQLVIYGGEGVCRIAAVGPSSLSGTDKTKLYYTLTPLTRSGTVLTPVDTKVLMRPILSRQEAEDLIAQLPAGQREAITLYYYEGFSAQEVAQALGVPRPTACMRLSRGRKRLRWLIETEGRNEP